MRLNQSCTSLDPGDPNVTTRENLPIRPLMIYRIINKSLLLVWLARVDRVEYPNSLQTGQSIQTHCRQGRVSKLIVDRVEYPNSLQTGQSIKTHCRQSKVSKLIVDRVEYPNSLYTGQSIQTHCSKGTFLTELTCSPIYQDFSSGMATRFSFSFVGFSVCKFILKPKLYLVSEITIYFTQTCRLQIGVSNVCGYLCRFFFCGNLKPILKLNNKY